MEELLVLVTFIGIVGAFIGIIMGVAEFIFKVLFYSGLWVELMMVSGSFAIVIFIDRLAIGMTATGRRNGLYPIWTILSSSIAISCVLILSYHFQ
jgi:hypothetical protein